MKILLFTYLLMIATLGFSQNNPVDFESGGFGANWTWTVFENDTNPPLEIISNPDPNGINTSETVAKFTALEAGAPFAGCETMHGADIGMFDLTSDNAIVKIMVWKSVISDVGIKFATPPGGSFGQVLVSNTLIDQWEELTFDFTPFLGHPKATNLDQLVIFPDFNARTSDNIIYFDNITFSDGTLGIARLESNSISAYPNPVDANWHVKAMTVILEIKVTNLTGKIVQEVQPRNTNHTLDLSGLSTGIYFAEVIAEGQNKILKLIKN
ncbi:MAG: T9SS type A sorting domain-containing protein [Flavobacteriaceae bacterium]|nr:T9SS type A sorting domain-containing protein [Flavobacteriaceae bacterium]